MNESEREARYFVFYIPPDLLRLVFFGVLHCHHLLDNSHQDQRVKLQETRAHYIDAILHQKLKYL